MYKTNILTYRYSTDTHVGKCPFCGHNTIVGNVDGDKAERAKLQLPQIEVCEHYKMSMYHPSGPRSYSAVYRDEN